MSACNYLLLLLFGTADALRLSQRMTRRSTLCTGVATLAARTMLAPEPAAAAGARVAVYPALEYLEPFYELKLSIDALASVAPQPERWPALRKRLDKFCGGPLSEQYYYLGLATQYTSQIKYEDLDAFVAADRQERQQAAQSVFESLRALKAGLEAPAPDASALEASAKAAQQSMARWLGLVPPEDIRRVEELLGAVRRADVNRDGRLNGDELGMLSVEQRAVWKARVALVGE